MPKKIISSTPITIHEVKELLVNRQHELSPLQARVYNYVSTYSKLSAETARSLVKELMEKFDLKADEACQIVNICPTTLEELRAILSGYRRLVSTILFSDQKLNEILQLINQYVSAEAKVEEV